MDLLLIVQDGTPVEAPTKRDQRQKNKQSNRQTEIQRGEKDWGERKKTRKSTAFLSSNYSLLFFFLFFFFWLFYFYFYFLSLDSHEILLKRAHESTEMRRIINLTSNLGKLVGIRRKVVRFFHSFELKMTGWLTDVVRLFTNRHATCWRHTPETFYKRYYE